MDALKLLREQAARKRDKTIQAARNEYRDALKEIDSLGMHYNLDVRTTHGARRKRTIHELIIKHMPKDQPFALRDILPILQKAEPHRKFIEATVRVVFKRLIDDGEVRKVRKSDHGFMLWCCRRLCYRGNRPAGHRLDCRRDRVRPAAQKVRCDRSRLF